MNPALRIAFVRPRFLFYSTKSPIKVIVIIIAPVNNCTIFNHFFSFFFEISLDIKKTISPMGIINPIANISNGITVSVNVVDSVFVISNAPIIGPVPENDDAVNTIGIIPITKLMDNHFDSIFEEITLKKPSSQSPKIMFKVTNMYLTVRFKEKLFKLIGVVPLSSIPIIM